MGYAIVLGIYSAFGCCCKGLCYGQNSMLKEKLVARGTIKLHTKQSHGVSVELINEMRLILIFN